MYNRDRLLGKFIQNYHFERAKSSFFVTKRGFIQYSIRGNTVYIEEFYLDHEYRIGKSVFDFANSFIEFCKRIYCNEIIGYVELEYPNGHLIEKLFKMYGMTKDEYQYSDHHIRYRKQI